MSLECLELLIRIKVGIFIVQAYNHSNVDKIGLHMIQESSRVSVCTYRPAHCMLNIPRLEERA
jgi:hypothetical protein